MDACGVGGETQGAVVVKPLTDASSHSSSHSSVPCGGMFVGEHRRATHHAEEQSVSEGMCDARSAETLLGQTIAHTEGNASEGTIAVPRESLRHLVFHQTHTRLQVKVSVAGKRQLSAHSDMYAPSVLLIAVVSGPGVLKAGNTHKFEGVRCIISARRGNGCDVDEIVEREVGILHLLAMQTPHARVHVEAKSVFGRNPVADAHLRRRTELVFLRAHDIKTCSHVDEEMVKGTLVLIYLHDARTLEHIVERAARHLSLGE